MKNSNVDQNQKRFGHDQSSQKTFVVPEGYFDEQLERILIAPKMAPESKWSITKYAIAASIAIVTSLSAALFFMQSEGVATDSLSSSDYATYLLLENTELDQLALHVSDQQLEYDLPNVSDESIEDYLLDQNIDINHIILEQ